MKYRTLKLLRRRKNARKRIRTTEKAVQALIIGLMLILVLLVGCENGARHSIEISEPTDHTSGDDGGKLKYKIIWGSTKHNDKTTTLNSRRSQSSNAYEDRSESHHDGCDRDLGFFRHTRKIKSTRN